MNDPLIKQLELAIQVEKGEVSWGEIQYRPLSEPPEFGWICVAPCGKPSWNFTNAEYRRKPKPLECWVNTMSGGSVERRAFDSFEDACAWALKHNQHVHEAGVGHLTDRVAVHMKEVL